jgi:hypothetical protein
VPTVDLGGVRTWYAVDGSGEPLVYKPELVAGLVLDFLTTEPVPTRIPIRRM